MSVQKSPYGTPLPMNEYEKQIIAQCNKMSIESKKFPEICSHFEPLECVVQCLEELSMLKEFRDSKYNYRLAKLKQLKNRFKKTFT